MAILLLAASPAGAGQSWTWSPAASLSQARAGHTATLLQDGKVLIAGGKDATGRALATAEVFDPATGAYASLSANMPNAVWGHTATLLTDGTVLMTGGNNDAGQPVASAHLFDPAAGTFTPLSMTTPRSRHTATQLADGRVLIAGGTDGTGALPGLEIYDPTTRAFAFAPRTLQVPRQGHGAAALADGRVLIVGGSNSSGNLDSAELYNPADGTVVAAASLNVARTSASAALLLDGSVLVAGGQDAQNQDLGSAEVYDPIRNAFTLLAAPMTTARSGHVGLALRHNGKVLLAGGTNAGQLAQTAEVYDPVTGTFWEVGPPGTSRNLFGANFFDLSYPGRLLATGGLDAANNSLASSEVFSYPTLRSDKPDYQPGDTVTLMGEGWLPGEVVDIRIKESSGDPDTTAMAVANASGAFSISPLQINSLDLGVSFLATASGQSSRWTAQTMFTDSGAFSYSPNTQQSLAAAAAGPAASFDQSVTAPENNGSFTASVQVASTGANSIPASWVSTAPNSLSFSTGSGSTKKPDTKSWTVSFTVPPGTFAGTYTANIKANPSISGVGVGPGTPVSLTVTTCTAPSVTGQPSSATKVVGESVTFSVTASGTTPLSYQWRKNGTTISGATSNTYTIGSVTTSDAGSFDVVVSNSCGSVTSSAATLTVNKATPVITWGNPADIAYGTALGATQLNATANVPGTFVYTPAAGTVLNARAAQTLHVDFTPTDTANYNTASKDVSINVLKATLTVTANNKTRTYGDDNPAFDATISGFQNGETLATSAVTGSPSCSTTAIPSSPVPGPYPISCTQGTLTAGNYDFTFVPGNLTITKAPLTVTAENKTREYGDANPAFTATFTGFKNSETLATSGVTGSPYCTSAPTPSSPVSGSPYAITCTIGSLAAGNYDFTFVDGQLTITKATLTVTADNKTREYGDPNPAFTASYAGFKNSETLATSGVTGSPSLATLATPSSPVSGSLYTITAALGTLAAGNYTFTFVNGQLTINKRDASVTPNAASKILGAPDPNPLTTGTLTNFVAADNVTATYSRTAGETVGTYTISATLSPAAVLGNYNITYNTANFAIQYAPAGLACYGAPGHQILPPINVDGASVFKQKSTVPAKFRVCDAYGNSVGTSGVVASFRLIQVVTGTTMNEVSETVDSTTPDTAFRWDSTDQQWIFNVSTKNLYANRTYVYRIYLNDGTWIQFQYGLK